MSNHSIIWTQPAPLWSEVPAQPEGAAREDFSRPAILRFATDDFMDDFLSVLATDPQRLGEYRAVRETWRGKLESPALEKPARKFALPFQRLGAARRRQPKAGTAPEPLSDAKPLPVLKLYQPAHMRHYLVTCCLVCQRPGLPDRHIEPTSEERVSYLIRRLFKPATAAPGRDPDDPRFWEEHAWVKTPAGHAWQKVRSDKRRNDKVVLDGEERLALFPSAFQQDDRRSRRLLAGVIPVGKREAYLGGQRIAANGSAASPPAGTSRITARKILLRKQVIEPWKVLVQQIAAAGNSNSTTVSNNGVESDKAPGGSPAAASTRSAREQAQVISWLTLSDCAGFFSLYIPELWQAVLSGIRPGASMPHMGAVFDALGKVTLPPPLVTDLLTEPHEAPKIPQSLGYPTPPANMREALAKFGMGASGLNTALTQKLDTAEQPYSRELTADRSHWPDFLFPLADPEHGPVPVPALNLKPLTRGEEEDLSLAESPDVNGALKKIDDLAVLLVRALAESRLNAGAPEPDIPIAALTPAEQGGGLFRIRCVYERPQCGPLHEDVVSEPTEPFDLAGFFDPEAPARPIRVGLPLDTSPAGLRKFDKNTAFTISDMLCGQMKRVKGLGLVDLVRSVLPWPLHKDLSVPDGGPCKDSGGGSIGMICSLSIPIITLCAFILLIIMVTLLDIIFRWLPYFIICFPVNGFKGKKT